MQNQEELQQTQKYVEQNIVRAQYGRKCVDGRYLPSQATGMIARPGGDCGYVMTLMAVSEKKGLNLSPEECFNAVYNALINLGEKFSMHTDHNVDPDISTRNGLIGCGHLAKAANEMLCKAYDVSAKNIEALVNYARELSRRDSSLELINLIGQHTEKGILVVDSEEYTVNARQPDLDLMYFVYDELRDNNFMRKLVEELHLPDVSFEEIKKESDIQLQATLHNLAKGLPVYKMQVIDSKPTVTYLSTV